MAERVDERGFQTQIGQGGRGTFALDGITGVQLLYQAILIPLTSMRLGGDDIACSQQQRRQDGTSDPD